MSTESALTTNVPPITWSTTGIVVPPEASVLAGVQADINQAFGGNLNFENLQTPQGQLSSSIAAAISNCYALFSQLVNGMDPDLNSGFMQDTIGRIYFMNRSPGTGTVVACTCIGLAGTPIPTGSPSNPQAKDTAGNLYYCVQGADILTGGSITLNFANCVVGPIGCPEGTLTGIYQTVPGWDQITNPAAGDLGSYVQSPEAFEYQREQSVAANAQGFLAAVFGAVSGLSGVIAVFCIENDSDAAVDYGPTGYPLAANSIYVGVIGGTPSAIAQAIFTKKSPGCPQNGNQTVTVYDTTYPAGEQPAYSVKYNIPNSVGMSCTVTLGSSTGLPSNINTLIQNAILALFQSGTQGPPAIAPAGIASLIIAANYFAPVLATSSGLPLLSITWGTLFSGTGSVTDSSTTLTISAVTSGFMAPGNYVTGTGIPANTYIVQQLSGTTGGVGTYQMSAEASASESDEAISSASGNLTQFQAGIDQYLTLAATNINVVTS